MRHSVGVLYRDDFVIAVSKPSGLIVHRGLDNDPVTLSDIVRDELIGAPIHAVHRLDRGTSGVMLFALNADSARHFQRALAAPETFKRYLALVRGPMREAVTLDHPILTEPGGERVDAITKFRPLETIERWTLVEAEPRTGRRHQIRRHLKHLSHPIVGDVRYGKGDINRMFRQQYDLHRLALHARYLRIANVDGSILELTAPIPNDLLLPLQRLGFSVATGA